MASDAWLDRYEKCVGLGQSVMEAINERNQTRRSGGNAARASSTAQGNLRQFSSSVGILREDLIRSSRTLSPRETERRQRMIDELSSQEKQMQEAVRSNAREDGGSSDTNFHRGRSRYQRLHDGFEEEDSAHFDVDALRNKQQMAIKEQDRGLEALSNVIAQQKNMALGIGDEIESQNVLIDDITSHAENTEARLLRETRHVSIVDRKSNTCWYWVVIVFLFIAIVVIAVVPYNGKP